MASLLYAMAIIVLFWVPVSLVLQGYYMHINKNNLQEAEFKLSRDMKTWAPVVGILLILLVPESALMAIAGMGLCFETYMTYTDSDADTGISKLRSLIKGDSNGKDL